MRHYYLILGAALRAARAPSPLSQRMPVRTAAAALVTHTRCSHTKPPLRLRAVPGAVNLAVIAVAANADRYPAAPAVVSPERSVSHRNAIPLQDWTMPCGTCIKAPWGCLSHAPHRGPGVDRKILPGPSPPRRQLARITKIGCHRGRLENQCHYAAALITRSPSLSQYHFGSDADSNPVNSVDYFWQARPD